MCMCVCLYKKADTLSQINVNSLVRVSSSSFESKNTLIMKKAVLCVGMCVLDIIHVCNEYPVEDSDKRYKILIMHTIGP